MSGISLEGWPKTILSIDARKPVATRERANQTPEPDREEAPYRAGEEAVSPAWYWLTWFVAERVRDR